MTLPAATAGATRREMLAHCLHSGAGALRTEPLADAAAWLALAREEDVVSLLQARLQSDPALARAQPDLATAVAAATHQEAWVSITFEGETRRLLALLRAQGQPALLLKGSAMAYWAYAQPHHRSCSDIDLLLASREAAEAFAGALATRGYDRHKTSGELVAYELLCTRQITPEWAVEIDVHWRLSNSALHADRFSFDELMAASVAIPSLGPNARGLGPVHATLHAAMHRASNIEIGVGDRLKWLYDFVVLEKHLGPSEWVQLVALARERQLAGVTLSALEATTSMFGAVFPERVLVGLREAAQGETLDASRLNDWAYMQAQTMRALPGWLPKLRWLWQRALPSADYMRYLYGDQGSYGGLLRERVKRAWHKWRGST